MIDRWNELWKKLDTAKKAEDLFYQLINAYSGKNRDYHNISHIMLCLNEFDRVKDRLKDPKEVKLAIWFHDVIYDLPRQNNRILIFDREGKVVKHPVVGE